MTGNTHGTAGLSVGVILALATRPTVEHAAIGILLSVAASMFPDSFTPRLPWIRWPVLESHRGISHFLLFHLFLASLVPPQWAWYVLLGLTSHALLDMPTGPGVVWLWPLPWRFQLPRHIRARNGGALERVTLVMLLVMPFVILLSGL